VKILELEVQNVRGIRSLVLRPEGQNFVIWGPNGSGKSAVVDAIDFLLTGRISRLTGRGTAGISLVRHGPHIDSEPSEAVVRAIVEVPGVEGPVELRRCVASPAALECNSEVRLKLEPLLELAERGQHVLTRREILKYVATEAGTRAQEIQHLLNLTSAETTRRALVTVHHRCGEAAEQAQNSLREARSRVSVIVGLPRFDSELLLRHVNEQRQLLGGSSIGSLGSAALQAGLTPPEIRGAPSNGGVGEVQPAVSSLRALLRPESRARLADAHKSVSEIVSAFRSEPSLLLAMRRRQLLEVGEGLIDETGACPLCETAWEPGELVARVRARRSEAETASGRSEELSRIAEEMRSALVTCADALKSLLAVLPQLGLLDLSPALAAWRADVEQLLETLGDPVARYPSGEGSSERVATVLAPDAAIALLDGIGSAPALATPGISREQAAWDRLTQLGEALVWVETADGRVRETELTHRRAGRLSEAYEIARNGILDGLYREVRDRFVALYRQLHGSHESSFAAELAPEGAGLDLRVDFYGRGVHPPQALHSEGHQDSMGICLYLALAERLTGGLIELTILDDVMMSVDADHRRELCGLLASAFPDRQLIITTHDRTWANQLRTEGVVTAKHCVQFYGWEVATGPRVLAEEDLWDRIRSDLEREDVPGAAHQLRRGCEAYFADVCDALWAPVRFRLNGRWDLGDFVLGAMRRHRELLKLAKAAANSWGHTEVIDVLSDVESTSGQIFSRTQAEQWAVNENVHYNAWADFRPADFVPVVEAFADLFDVFRCPVCTSLLRVVGEGPNAAAWQCTCGAVTRTLRSAP
jgi:energy-coupling factor transporter ATP-binding protein EcfA2